MTVVLGALLGGLLGLSVCEVVNALLPEWELKRRFRLALGVACTIFTVIALPVVWGAS